MSYILAFGIPVSIGPNLNRKGLV